ncbi:MAG: hypothetical protein GX200_05765 [Firmicutes bacterium]|nr:hypothetical protein [Bacillota bacterium]
MTCGRGAAMLWLLFLVALLLILGTSLLGLSRTELTVSAHLLNAARAQYAAEAGVELAVAYLGQSFIDLGEEGWLYEHAHDPAFAVQAEKKDNRTLLITSVGYAGNLAQKVEVPATYRPLGRQVLVAGKLAAGELSAEGHVTARKVFFASGISSIDGDLRAERVETAAGATYTVSGHLCPDWLQQSAAVDFSALRQRAEVENWEEPPLSAGGEYIMTGPAAGPLFAPDDAVIDLQETADCFLVADGDITVAGVAPGSRVAALAAGDVILPPVSVWEGSLFLYAAGDMLRSGEEMLYFAGCLVAGEMEINKLHVRYCDEAVWAYLEILPKELFRLGATFDLEWADPEPRR